MVSNWISFSLIIFALGFRLFYSVFELSDFMFFYQGLLGLGIFFILGNLMYYGRFFAGGDAKLLIALGAILPMSLTFSSNIQYFIFFFFIFLFVGAIYGIIWSVFLFSSKYPSSAKEFKKKIKENKKLLFFSLIVALMVFSLSFYDVIFSYFGILIFLLPFLLIYAKTIDETCLVKKVYVSNLDEGDWLYQRLKIGKKYIEPKWHGLTREQIKEIRKEYSSVKIKQGIPFVPSFFISFLVFFWMYFKGFNIGFLF